jgi:hypothetical protein
VALIQIKKISHILINNDYLIMLWLLNSMEYHSLRYDLFTKGQSVSQKTARNPVFNGSTKFLNLDEILKFHTLSRSYHWCLVGVNEKMRQVSIDTYLIRGHRTKE